MTQAGITYGDALYSLAKAEALTDAIHRDLKVLQESFRAEPDFPALLDNPAISKAQRCQILDDCFRDRVHPYVLNFLKILTEKGYIRHFGDCCESYTQHHCADSGILPVTAVTAVAMTPSQTQTLKEKLQTITGKEILLECRIDPSLLGGVQLRYGGMLLEDTVSHRLESLRALLANTVL